MKCPNCGFEQADGSAECQMCRIVFSKFRARQERPVAAATTAPLPEMPRPAASGQPYAAPSTKSPTEKEQNARKTASAVGWILAFGFWFVWRSVAPEASWWTGFLICVAIIAIGETFVKRVLLSR
jgi:hypothetical protein